ncbi:neuroendocrine convertase 2-like isoform X1 [Antedon mediterranea]|uniref:neuroendocrine convertase 2-like isoform X1 n=1 Tax=Antedon mediterranea TaxID=105859 RepID=UPI003AF48910
MVNSLPCFLKGLTAISVILLLIQGTTCEEIFTNNFIVEVHDDVTSSPKSIAEDHGFSYHGKVLNKRNVFHFTHKDVPVSRSRRSADVIDPLENHPQVKRVVQLTGFKRSKRGFLDLNERNEQAPSIKPNRSTNPKQKFNDPLFDKQWFLLNDGQADGKPGLDLNVIEAWDLGYFGEGITIAIMDDGIDYLHPDIGPNYNAEASYDFSSNDRFPYPRYTNDWFNSHGTRCAGEVSAVAGNGICGVGVAYKSKVAGIRMLDQPYMTDMIEASSMSHKPQLIDIYSASWGPQDDGRTVDGPRDLTLDAIADGVNKGRNGKGSIFVWASGDGGPDDDCNCDGYASSMWTISINSAINDGRTALYDESCSSTLASTFSNGRNRHPEAGVATTDLYGNCTLSHSGTSAAAPEAAGVFALALSANRNLTWRDLQHITVLTSDRKQLYDEVYQWQCNGVGLQFNHLFGFGVLDAGKMVKMAAKWETVSERFHCTGASYTGKSTIPNRLEGPPLELRLNTDGCKDQDNAIKYLEHVQAIITLNSTRRGDVVINLISPMGTNSMLLSTRPRDDDNIVGFQSWPFMTTHTWGEDPKGEWTLQVSMNGNPIEHGTLLAWTLVLHGTKTAPYIDEAKSKSPCKDIKKDSETDEEKAAEDDKTLTKEEEELDDAIDNDIISESAKINLNTNKNTEIGPDMFQQPPYPNINPNVQQQLPPKINPDMYKNPFYYNEQEDINSYQQPLEGDFSYMSRFSDKFDPEEEPSYDSLELTGNELWEDDDKLKEIIRDILKEKERYRSRGSRPYYRI